MRLNLGHHLLSLRVLANLCCHQRVLHQAHVHSNVGVVILVDESLGGLAVQEGHVLGHGVAWLHVVFNWHKLFCVAHTQHFDHLTVQLRQVVNLRGRLRELDDSLILHDPLSHGRAVRIGHWNHFHDVIVLALGHGISTLRGVLVFAWRVVADDVLQKLELLLHGVMHASLNGAHRLELALKQCQSGAHRSIGPHVADLHVGNRTEASAFFCDAIKQRRQNLAWLFVRQGHDVVTHRTRGHIHIAPLAWGDWSVVALDAQAA